MGDKMGNSSRERQGLLLALSAFRGAREARGMLWPQASLLALPSCVVTIDLPPDASFLPSELASPTRHLLPKFSPHAHHIALKAIMFCLGFPPLPSTSHDLKVY